MKCRAGSSIVRENGPGRSQRKRECEVKADMLNPFYQKKVVALEQKAKHFPRRA